MNEAMALMMVDKFSCSKDGRETVIAKRVCSMFHGECAKDPSMLLWYAVFLMSILLRCHYIGGLVHIRRPPNFHISSYLWVDICSSQ